MTSLLTTMRQRLTDAENDAKRLRAAIEILERAEKSAPAPRRERARSQAATAATRSRPAPAADVVPTQDTTPAADTADAPAPAATRRTRKPAAKKPAKPAKSKSVVVPLEKLLKVVGDNPGMTTTAIAGETGGDQSALLELLKESEQKGEVRRQGERRATSWYRITDEDRIAARAAELAAQARTTGGKSPARTAKRKVTTAS